MNKQKYIPFALIAFAALSGATLGLNQLSPIAHAQSTTTQVAPSTSGQPATQIAETGAADAKQEPSYTSSVKGPAESATEVDDATEAKQLASLAKITPDQAKAAAEKSASQTASSVKLEDENGNVVYAVAVGSQEVKVDAGNGQVLHTEAADGAEAATSESATK